MFKRIIATSFITCSCIALQASQPQLTQSPAPLPLSFEFIPGEDPAKTTERAMAAVSNRMLFPDRSQRTYVTDIIVLFRFLDQKKALHREIINHSWCYIQAQVEASKEYWKIRIKAQVKADIKRQSADTNDQENRKKSRESADLLSRFQYNFSQMAIAAAQLEYLSKVLSPQP